MRILLTNDDGITSPGIYLLAIALRQAGHRVFMVAPDTNRSGCSHSIQFLSGPIKLTETEKDCWACSGTPVDCVIISVSGGIPEINESPLDLVLSGINAGANLGTDITYSGTASAARQGSFFGIPSIALSLVENDSPWQWETVVSYVTEKLDEFLGYWKKNSFVNINFPNNNTKPLTLVPAFPSVRYYSDSIVTFNAPEGGIYCFPSYGKVDNIPEEGSDWAEVLKNNAAFSVIMTQPALLE